LFRGGGRVHVPSREGVGGASHHTQRGEKTVEYEKGRRLKRVGSKEKRGERKKRPRKKKG